MVFGVFKFVGLLWVFQGLVFISFFFFFGGGGGFRVFKVFRV